MADEFGRKECKLDCQWRAINLLVSRMVSLRADCRTSKNPDGCIKTLNDTMLAERVKQRKIRELISQVRRQKEEFRRKQTTGAAQGATQ
jgi:hypothetical protein